jgi:hypothetical protein
MANERSKSTSFIDHALRIETSDGPRWKMPLHAKSFHAAIMAALSDAHATKNAKRYRYYVSA